MGCGYTAVGREVALASGQRTSTTHSAVGAAPSVSKVTGALGRPLPGPNGAASDGPGAPPRGSGGNGQAGRPRRRPRSRRPGLRPSPARGFSTTPPPGSARRPRPPFPC
ncbi:uncharacterized protein C10orf95-like [Camelus ferus]|uniref:Uncharacterized protein C10orf95-like n=1 Tax=Camelus ferus TaxID=419612 RepID=A0A8B8TR10_CAMFR|nr:uncharacterized protein C10orf95-like [Camelus ferus]